MNPFRLALIGNPNSGKSTLFNTLTGLRQHTGNFPGVTVDKKEGSFTLNEKEVSIIDYPGTYSVHPLTSDEHVVLKALLGPKEQRPNGILYIADATQLNRHLLLYTQVRDLGYPTLLVLSMSDLAEDQKIELDIAKLEEVLGEKIIEYSKSDENSLTRLKDALSQFMTSGTAKPPIYTLSQKELLATEGLDTEESAYGRLLLLHHGSELKNLAQVTSLPDDYDDIQWQVDETLNRFQTIEKGLTEVYKKENDYLQSGSFKIDQWLTHPIIGPTVFLIIMFLVFQIIFSVAEWPMNWIDDLFGWAANGASGNLPSSWWADMIVEGIIPGLGGVIIFIPQIALLFFLIGLLEESGYMARAVFLFDRFFQRFGLNGRSLVALVSASACAIPAVMSARSIKNEKERLITILVAPFMSCSARTPVYIVLIAFIVSSERMWGWVNPQGLVFVGFYLLGLLGALGFAWILKILFKSEEGSFLMLEMPRYQWPDIQSVLMNTWHKVRSFIVEAGKVILLISMLLWFLASYGPSGRELEVEQLLSEKISQEDLNDQEQAALQQSLLLESSYAGIMGKTIEPLIRPLGFDWKIGIALITSFAAREVFVGTMATIYSVDSEEDYDGIQNKMRRERFVDTLEPVYTKGTALALVIFYVFAMQCMSTLAVVKKETGGWKWPIVQFIGMTAVAYLAAWVVQLIW